jgi:Family of unknown function (DUF5681)
MARGDGPTRLRRSGGVARDRPASADRNREQPPDQDYQVGYGKPPVHSRFKPGTSGNPQGRPKRSRNLRTIIQEALTKTIKVREGDEIRSISKLEGVVLRQVESALKGNDRAALATLKITAQVGLLDERDGAGEVPALSPAEKALVDEVLDRASIPQKSKGPDK